MGFLMQSRISLLFLIYNFFHSFFSIIYCPLVQCNHLMKSHQTTFTLTLFINKLKQKIAAKLKKGKKKETKLSKIINSLTKRDRWESLFLLISSFLELVVGRIYQKLSVKFE